MIEAIIFDFDGLIVDTETASLQAWQRTYQKYGYHLHQHQWAGYLISDSFDPLGHLHELCGKSTSREQLDAERSTLKTTLCNATYILPGVKEWLIEAKRLGIRLGVASSSSREWVSSHLGRVKLTGYFDAICTREDVSSTKPAADLYLLSLQRLNATAVRTIAIEDSPNGCASALAANLHCIIVPNSVTCEMTFPGGSWRLNSLADETLAGFLDRTGFHKL